MTDIPAAVSLVHAVEVTDRRIDCLPGCWGPEPHLHEYRAIDVNPNR